ncbi:dethiobiotin synthase [Chamaesiphon polymorphus]|uniref:ATP-dependent dethiobiotin synthetase BioD n=1 Tax=Chamaesiphon polymorphus CCALA 037 TaxID=2107692 RepID=A0A2T1GH24_9CYAN|nr:dethiobiotin synthase [Chamaesiphon polymorphus]PSB56989.1 ATP-dependent dethiobiotin synthetase BioD [Chamaesiphon polymorphus CCALA 037]
MLLVTSTDTEAGKTALTASLAAYGRKYRPQQNWGILKPIQCGRGDREFYSRVFARSIEDINPIYLEAPLAPPIAAAQAGVDIDLGIAWQALQRMLPRHGLILVEGIGGLGTPLTAELVVADLAREWRLPTVLVVPVKLGAIGLAVANVALARHYNVQLRGIVLNCPQPLSDAEIANLAPAELIQSLTNTPVLGCLPYLPNLEDLDLLAAAAANLELEVLLPNLAYGGRQVRV